MQSATGLTVWCDCWQPENYWGTEGQYRAWRYVLPDDSDDLAEPADTGPDSDWISGSRLRTGAGPVE